MLSLDSTLGFSVGATNAARLASLWVASLAGHTWSGIMPSDQDFGVSGFGSAGGEMPGSGTGAGVGVAGGVVVEGAAVVGGSSGAGIAAVVDGVVVGGVVIIPAWPEDMYWPVGVWPLP